MISAYKPETYSTVSTYLVVGGASDTIEFLSKVFGAVEIRRFSTEDGRVRHAEVRLDDSVLMLADSAEGWPAAAGHVHIYVADVDTVYVRAIDAGAESVQTPTQKDDPDRRAAVRDAGGTTWWIATRVG